MKKTHEAFHTAKLAFENGKTKSFRFRKKQLKQLLLLYEENREEMENSLNVDLRRSKEESALLEIDNLIVDLKYTISCLKKWTATEKETPSSFMSIFAQVTVHKEPYGVVLIIGSWNLPFLLCLKPLAGAIAAGNCVIVKPSHVSSGTSSFIADTLPKYLDNECYHVILGGINETTSILNEKFNFIFFTGSIDVGKIVQERAAQNLIPTYLALTGKNPVYIDETADLKMVAKRVIYGKFLNAGQSCTAPDYILCTREVRKKLITIAKAALEEFYGRDPKFSPDFCRIVSEAHFWKLVSLLNNCTIAIGGRTDLSGWYIEPSIVVKVKPTDPLMQEEILGPILPIVDIENMADAVKYINQQEKCLLLYIFSTNKENVELVINNTTSSGVSVNDTFLHNFVCDFPISSINGANMYQGRSNFETFTHRKSVVKRNYNNVIDKLFSIRYPPFSAIKLFVVREFTRKRRILDMIKYLPDVGVFATGIVTAIVFSFLKRKAAITHHKLY